MFEKLPSQTPDVSIILLIYIQSVQIQDSLWHKSYCMIAERKQVF